MTAYYNDNNAFAAQWLRNLIDAGHIAPGHVDQRSIAEVRPSDLAGFTQCHFFAGIGVWSHALRLAGWPDDRPVWTGSCPCQPFSNAGERKGFADERHLWPVWFDLIGECRPDTILGEQVASKAALAWWDGVSADLERAAYAAAAVDLCSAGVGSFHMRQRLYWLAHSSNRQRREGHERAGEAWGTPGPRVGGELGGMGNAQDYNGGLSNRSEWLQDPQPVRPCQTVRLGDTSGAGSPPCQCETLDRSRRREERGATEQSGRPPVSGAGAPHGIWRDADWLLCTDGKWRPVEPGTFPLAHGVAGRVGQLRAYGNAIDAHVAQAFIQAVM